MLFESIPYNYFNSAQQEGSVGKKEKEMTVGMCGTAFDKHKIIVSMNEKYEQHTTVTTSIEISLLENIQLNTSRVVVEVSSFIECTCDTNAIIKMLAQKMNNN